MAIVHFLLHPVSLVKNRKSQQKTRTITQKTAMDAQETSGNAQASNLHVQVREEIDSDVEIVVETQESQQHFHPNQSMSMPSFKVSTHPQKLFCRRTQLPQPIPQVKHEGLAFSNMPFTPFSHYPFPMMPSLVDPQNCNSGNLYIPQASMSHVPPVSIQSATADSNAMKKRARGRPKKSLEKLDEGKKECKEELNGKYTRWDDKFTVALIHVRGEMQDEFSMPPKQGVNLWHTVVTRIVARCPGFDKDAAACRKKWRSIYKDYAKDKAHNNISGNDRSNQCEWFSIVDEYMGTRANVTKAVHGGAITQEEKVEDVEEKPTIEKKLKKDRTCILLHEIKEGRKEFLYQMKDIEAQKLQIEGQRLEILAKMEASFADLVKRI